MTAWHGLITGRGGFPWATIEDAVANALKERGHITWIAREHRPTKTRPDLNVPIVRGIVFVQAPVEWYELRKIRGYIRPLAAGPERRPAIITQEQIDIMQRACAPLLRERKAPGGLKPGDRARVRLGAVADIEAVIREIRKGSVGADVELLGSVRRVTIPMEQVEPA